MLNAGRLDQRITLQSRVAAVNGFGENVPTWSDVATVWAAADPKRGREFFAAAQQQAENPVAFRIRYRAGVTHHMRVLWRGEPFDIAAPPVEAFGRQESLELYCINGVRDGQ